MINVHFLLRKVEKTCERWRSGLTEYDDARDRAQAKRKARRIPSPRVVRKRLRVEHRARMVPSCHPHSINPYPRTNPNYAYSRIYNQIPMSENTHSISQNVSTNIEPTPRPVSKSNSRGCFRLLRKSNKEVLNSD